MKSFASEMLTVLPLLCMYAQEVLSGTGVMVDELTCLVLLTNIMDLLALGDRVLQLLDTLDTCVSQHFDLCVRLYGKFLKPRDHYTLHLPRTNRLHGLNMKAFVTERKSKRVKAIANFCEGANVDLVVTRGYLNAFLEHYKTTSNLDGTYLVNPCIADWALPVLRKTFPMIRSAKASRAAHIKSGEVRVGDVCLVRDRAQSLQAIECNNFFEVCDGQETVLVCLHTPFRKLSSNEWKREQYVQAASLDSIIKPTAYARVHGDRIKLCMPHYV